MITSLLIFLGAGIGGLCRYWLSNGIHALAGRDFPYGTLAINISGSFLMGFLFVVLVDKFAGMSAPLRAFLLIGFLGGYTTFSSFSIETLNLVENGAWFSAILNLVLSVVLGMLFVWLGALGGRQL